MSNLSDTLLAAVLAYGPMAFGLTLMLTAFGAPLPATLLLLAAGAFTRQGLIDGTLAALLGLLGSVLGDSGSYLVGRYGGAFLQRRIAHIGVWQQAQATFTRSGSLAILLTRFLLTPLAWPTNLIAGSGQYPFARFLALDTAGELVWVVIYGGLGYLFADRWEALSDVVGNLSGVLVGLLVLAVGGYMAYRHRNGRHLAA